MALKKIFRKKKHEILIFFKNKVICLPKSREGNTERFRPIAKKKCIHSLQNNNTNNTFFFFLL